MTVTKYLNINGVRIAYLRKGEGHLETIVLAPSMLFDKRMFVHQMSGLADRYNVIAYDHRGHGESSRAADDRYDMDAYYDDATAFIEALGVGPVHFGGNSMGGFVALRLAARRPDLIKTAIAMASSGDRETNRDQFAKMIDIAAGNGLAPIAEVLSGLFFGKTSLENSAFEPTRRQWTDHFKGQDCFAAKLMRGVVFRTGINRELMHSQVPVLAIAGTEDAIYGISQSQGIADAVLRGKFVAIQQAGHSVALEQPALVNTEMAAFIDSIAVGDQ